MKGDGKALERRAVYCTHSALEAEMDNRTLCLTCHRSWINGTQRPKVVIAYINLGEEDGRDG